MKSFDFNNFNFFGNNSNTSSKKRADKQRRGRQCRIEELEGREMLSASPWLLANDYFDTPQGDVVQIAPPEVQENNQIAAEQSLNPVAEEDAIITNFKAQSVSSGTDVGKGTETDAYGLSDWTSVTLTWKGFSEATAYRIDWFQTTKAPNEVNNDPPTWSSAPTGTATVLSSALTVGADGTITHTLDDFAKEHVYWFRIAALVDGDVVFVSDEADAQRVRVGNYTSIGSFQSTTDSARDKNTSPQYMREGATNVNLVFHFRDDSGQFAYGARGRQAYEGLADTAWGQTWHLWVSQDGGVTWKQTTEQVALNNTVVADGSNGKQLTTMSGVNTTTLQWHANSGGGDVNLKAGNVYKVALAVEEGGKWVPSDEFTTNHEIVGAATDVPGISGGLNVTLIHESDVNAYDAKAIIFWNKVTGDLENGANYRIMVSGEWADVEIQDAGDGRWVAVVGGMRGQWNTIWYVFTVERYANETPIGGALARTMSGTMYMLNPLHPDYAVPQMDTFTVTAPAQVGVGEPVTISWTPPANSWGADELNYTVEYSTNGINWTKVDAADIDQAARTASFNVPRGKYTICVTATDSGLLGERTVLASTLVANPIEGFEAQAVSSGLGNGINDWTSVKLDWEKLDGAEKYRIDWYVASQGQANNGPEPDWNTIAPSGSYTTVDGNVTSHTVGSGLLFHDVVWFHIVALDSDGTTVLAESSQRARVGNYSKSAVLDTGNSGINYIAVIPEGGTAGIILQMLFGPGSSPIGEMQPAQGMSEEVVGQVWTLWVNQGDGWKATTNKTQVLPYTASYSNPPAVNPSTVVFADSDTNVGFAAGDLYKWALDEGGTPSAVFTSNALTVDRADVHGVGTATGVPVDGFTVEITKESATGQNNGKFTVTWAKNGATDQASNYKVLISGMDYSVNIKADGDFFVAVIDDLPYFPRGHFVVVERYENSAKTGACVARSFAANQDLRTTAVPGFLVSKVDATDNATNDGKITILWSSTAGDKTDGSNYAVMVNGKAIDASEIKAGTGINTNKFVVELTGLGFGDYEILVQRYADTVGTGNVTNGSASTVKIKGIAGAVAGFTADSVSSGMGDGWNDWTSVNLNWEKYDGAAKYRIDWVITANGNANPGAIEPDWDSVALMGSYTTADGNEISHIVSGFGVQDVVWFRIMALDTNGENLSETDNYATQRVRVGNYATKAYLDTGNSGATYIAVLPEDTRAITLQFLFAPGNNNPNGETLPPQGVSEKIAGQIWTFWVNQGDGWKATTTTWTIPTSIGNVYHNYANFPYTTLTFVGGEAVNLKAGDLYRFSLDEGGQPSNDYTTNVVMVDRGSVPAAPGFEIKAYKMSANNAGDAKITVSWNKDGADQANGSNYKLLISGVDYSANIKADTDGNFYAVLDNLPEMRYLVVVERYDTASKTGAPLSRGFYTMRSGDKLLSTDAISGFTTAKVNLTGEGADDGMIMVTWNRVAGDQTDGSNYKVFVDGKAVPASVIQAGTGAYAGKFMVEITDLGIGEYEILVQRYSDTGADKALAGELNSAGTTAIMVNGDLTNGSIGKVVLEVDVVEPDVEFPFTQDNVAVSAGSETGDTVKFNFAVSDTMCLDSLTISYTDDEGETQTIGKGDLTMVGGALVATITGLTTGKPYTFTFAVVAASGYSLTTPATFTLNATPTKTAVPDPQLDPPTSVTATQTTGKGSTSATVTWDQMAPAVGGTVSYELQYSVDGDVWITVTAYSEDAGVFTAIIDGLAGGKDYQFRVRTVETVGAAKYASEWSAVEAPQKVTTAAAGTTVMPKPKVKVDKKAATVNSVTLDVTKNPGLSYIVTGTFKVGKKDPRYIAANKGMVTETFSYIVKAGGSQLVITGLQAGTKYTFMVTAIGADGSAATGKNIVKVVASTAKYTASKIKLAKVTGKSPALTSFQFTTTPPGKPADVKAFDTFQTKIVVSYTVKVGKVKTTYEATLIDGELAELRTGGTLVTGEHPFKDLAASVTGATTTLTGLPAAGTKYAVAVSTIAIGFDSTVGTVESLAGKASISTAKFAAPSVKSVAFVAGTPNVVTLTYKKNYTIYDGDPITGIQLFTDKKCLSPAAYTDVAISEATATGIKISYTGAALSGKGTLYAKLVADGVESAVVTLKYNV